MMHSYYYKKEKRLLLMAGLVEEHVLNILKILRYK